MEEVQLLSNDKRWSGGLKNSSFKQEQGELIAMSAEVEIWSRSVEVEHRKRWVTLGSDSDGDGNGKRDGFGKSSINRTEKIMIDECIADDWLKR